MVNVANPPTIDWGAELARHDRWLRCIVLARLGERQGVDEVMQEVGLAAVKQQAPIHDPAKITRFTLASRAASSTCSAAIKGQLSCSQGAMTIATAPTGS